MSARELARPLRFCSERGLVYERCGSGRTVVLLHGWCLNGRLWTYEQALLAEEFDVLTPDLPGLGRSDGLGGPYALERYADDVAHLLAEAEVEDAIVVGFAFGAAVALSLAMLDESRIGGLVLIGTPSARHVPNGRMLASMRQDWPDFARRSARSIFKQEQSDATLRWVESMFLATRLSVALETWMAMREFDPLPITSELTVPALFIHGSEDEFAPLSVAVSCAESVPDGRLEVIPDCGHLVVLDQRQRFHDALRKFIEERS